MLVRVVVCSVYCPTGVSKEARKEFFDTFSDFCEEAKKKGDHVVIGTDANACVGNRNSVEHWDPDTDAIRRTLGPHGDVYCNDNGAELVSHLTSHGLSDVNSHFEKKHHRAWESRLPDRRKRAESKPERC